MSLDDIKRRGSRPCRGGGAVLVRAAAVSRSWSVPRRRRGPRPGRGGFACVGRAAAVARIGTSWPRTAALGTFNTGRGRRISAAFTIKNERNGAKMLQQLNR